MNAPSLGLSALTHQPHTGGRHPIRYVGPPIPLIPAFGGHAPQDPGGSAGIEPHVGRPSRRNTANVDLCPADFAGRQTTIPPPLISQKNARISLWGYSYGGTQC